MNNLLNLKELYEYYEVNLIDNIVTTEKNVFVRCDFDGSVKDNQIIDTYKINLVLDTINYLIKTGAKIIIGTHLQNKNESTEVIAEYLDKRLKTNVYYLDKIFDNPIENKIVNRINVMDTCDILILENLVHLDLINDKKGLEFAQKISSAIHIFVNEAFSLLDKNYSTTIYIPLLTRPAIGFNFARELQYLSIILNKYQRHFTALFFGNITTEFDLLEIITTKADYLITDLFDKIYNDSIVSEKINNIKDIADNCRCKIISQNINKFIDNFNFEEIQNIFNKTKTILLNFNHNSYNINNENDVNKILIMIDLLLEIAKKNNGIVIIIDNNDKKLPIKNNNYLFQSSSAKILSTLLINEKEFLSFNVLQRII